MLPTEQEMNRKTKRQLRDCIIVEIDASRRASYEERHEDAIVCLKAVALYADHLIRRIRQALEELED